MTDGWRVLNVRVPVAIDDEVAAVLGAGSLGVEVAPSSPGVTELRVYLGPGEDTEAWRERAAGVLRAHGLGTEATQLAVDPVADGRWVERWQASLAPIPLGTRFVILAAEGHAVEAGREAIRLIPGMAFGTGEHETTRMCAAALERHVARGSRWLDLGTGTGILAIVAARCGAEAVLALDTEPQAIGVASEVLAANAATDVVEVRLGSIDDRRGERFDGVVANIQSSFFLARAAAVADAVEPGGRLIASGFLEDDVPEIEAALVAAGFSIDARTFDGPWACLDSRRVGR